MSQFTRLRGNRRQQLFAVGTAFIVVLSILFLFSQSDEQKRKSTSLPVATTPNKPASFFGSVPSGVANSQRTKVLQTTTANAPVQKQIKQQARPSKDNAVTTEISPQIENKPVIITRQINTNQMNLPPRLRAEVGDTGKVWAVREPVMTPVALAENRQKIMNGERLWKREPFEKETWFSKKSNSSQSD